MHGDWRGRSGRGDAKATAENLHERREKRQRTQLDIKLEAHMERKGCIASSAAKWGSVAISQLSEQRENDLYMGIFHRKRPATKYMKKPALQGIKCPSLEGTGKAIEFCLVVTLVVCK